jgi:hypothetical protein
MTAPTRERSRQNGQTSMTVWLNGNVLFCTEPSDAELASFIKDVRRTYEGAKFSPLEMGLAAVTAVERGEVQLWQDGKNTVHAALITYVAWCAEAAGGVRGLDFVGQAFDVNFTTSREQDWNHMRIAICAHEGQNGTRDFIEFLIQTGLSDASIRNLTETEAAIAHGFWSRGLAPDEVKYFPEEGGWALTPSGVRKCADICERAGLDPEGIRELREDADAAEASAPQRGEPAYLRLNPASLAKLESETEAAS